MKINCHHVDTCVSDYWSGHHLPHVSIIARNGMSFKEVRQAIVSEIVQGAVCGSGEDARLLAGYYVSEEKRNRAEQLHRAAFAAINRDVVPAKKGARNAFPELDKNDESDFDVCVNAYFVFEVIE